MRLPGRAWRHAAASLAVLAVASAAMLGTGPVADLPDLRHALACLRSDPWIPCVP